MNGMKTLDLYSAAAAADQLATSGIGQQVALWELSRMYGRDEEFTDWKASKCRFAGNETVQYLESLQ
jgi:hypothetical protein